MKLTKSAGRWMLLIALFAFGVWLIRHIGLHGVHSEPHVSPEPAAKEVKAAPSEKPPIWTDASPNPVEAVSEENPGAGMMPAADGRLLATDPILFNSGSPSLRESSIPKLNKIAQFMIRNPLASLEIIGHTDNLGPEEVNRKVSGERASLVLEYLVSQGVHPSRLSSRGMGSSDPIDTNDTQLGRQANRRIEFLVKDNETPAANKGNTE